MKKYPLNIITVNKVLHKDWNPIGCGVPEDEYISYAKVILKLLKQKCSKKLIKDYMLECQLGMGFKFMNDHKIDDAFVVFKSNKWL